MRMSIDVGGTFTDLVVDRGGGSLQMFKSPTTYPDPLHGIVAAITKAAEKEECTIRDLLSRTEHLFHSTTRAINAVVTGQTALTAFLCTKGHPDSLLIREGGRVDPFNYRLPYPDGYVPRALTFEMPGRIWADGREIEPLDEAEVIAQIGKLKALKVEAVAVTLIWSIVNPAHEIRVGELLEEHLPGVPVTLSHRLNPTIREYRRASSCAIDASLKPVMSQYLRTLQSKLTELGMSGQIFAVTSQGGLVDLEQLAERPILALNSGPSMAPVAGRLYAELEERPLAIVTDAGGTTYDVSLVRDGIIPWTRETWLGQIYQGHLTGFPSVDVKSIGAGGGSIASVDSLGLLKVGPESAGSEPGPVCYGRGGTTPTVTDAALVLGYIDPAYFLGGDMALAIDATRAAIQRHVSGPLDLGIEDAALAIIDLATEQMVNAIEDITVKQGIDPEDTVLIAGGGASGLNCVQIAKRLRCAQVIVPDVGAALSAAGAMISEMTFEFARTEMIRTSEFDAARAGAACAALKAQADSFFSRAGADAGNKRIDYSFEGRYPSQVWEIDVPLRRSEFTDSSAIEEIVQDFHDRHTELFSFRDDGDIVEIMSFRARASCRVGDAGHPALAVDQSAAAVAARERPMIFHETGQVSSPAYRFDALATGEAITGPAVIESSFTTIVLPPGSRAEPRVDGHIVIEFDA
jgi:N-methylhydantoinase A